ncbi:MAG: TrkH family potassium uptake protein [Clostridium sp.]
MRNYDKKKWRLSAVQILAIGFAITILLGAFILMLPISSASGEVTSFIDALFTSTSAVCVTGLVTVDTGTHWTYFGQTVIIVLIQIGGLGFMSLGTFVAILLGRKITLRDRLLMQEAMNTFSIQGLVKMVRYVLGFTLAVQLAGALIISTQLVPEFGIVRGILYSLFHSISAFCNAGFDLFGNFASLTGYANNPVMIMTISALIIIGGLGFTVWLEIYNRKTTKKISLHAKIVILITLVLLFGGMLLMLIFEWNNPNTLGGMNLRDKLVNGWFASVTPRTAGFNSISTSDMTISGKLLTIIFMFIGGSPGSTAGGLKTATFGIVCLTVFSVIRGREDTEAFGRRIGKDLVYKAFSLLFIGVTLVLLMTMILSITEPGHEFMDLLYEVTSAFGTVGVTTGVTTTLSPIGKVIIMIMMYLGRVGPLTVALAFANVKKKRPYKYPEGKVLIG